MIPEEDREFFQNNRHTYLESNEELGCYFCAFDESHELHKKLPEKLEWAMLANGQLLMKHRYETRITRLEVQLALLLRAVRGLSSGQV